MDLFDEYPSEGDGSTTTARCPYCHEEIELYFEPDVEGTLVQDCEVCCNPWNIHVSHDEDGALIVEVSRAQ